MTAINATDKETAMKIRTKVQAAHIGHNHNQIKVRTKVKAAHIGHNHNKR